MIGIDLKPLVLDCIQHIVLLAWAEYRYLPDVSQGR